MKGFITLDEAIRNEVINDGDPINFECFSKGNTSTILSSLQTGYREEQNFFREDLKWFYAKDRFGLPTMWGSATENVLVLYGKRGYRNALANINSICQIYTNIKLNLIARSIVEEDIPLIYKNSNRIQKSFLGNLSKHQTTDESILFGIRIADQYGVKSCYLCSSYDYRDQVAYPVRPAVTICSPQKILLDTRKNNGLWKVIPSRC